MTGVGFAGRGGPFSSGPFPRPAARQVCPGPPRLREGQRDHPCAGVTMSTVATTAAPDGRQAAISDAARRLYDAEVALHIARQTGVAAWISAALALRQIQATRRAERPHLRATSDDR